MVWLPNTQIRRLVSLQEAAIPERCHTPSPGGTAQRRVTSTRFHWKRLPRTGELGAARPAERRWLWLQGTSAGQTPSKATRWAPLSPQSASGGSLYKSIYFTKGFGSLTVL